MNNIGRYIEILSPNQYIHQVFFDSEKRWHSNVSQISLCEAVVNWDNNADIITQFTEEFVGNSAYQDYGKQFTIYDNILYISSYRKETSPRIHTIHEVKACGHHQVYNTTTHECQNVGSGFVTYGIQDTEPFSCFTNTASRYQNYVKKTQCDGLYKPSTF